MHANNKKTRMKQTSNVIINQSDLNKSSVSFFAYKDLKMICSTFCFKTFWDTLVLS